MSTDSQDAIAGAFEAIRREAQRRNGRVPDLSKQGKPSTSHTNQGRRVQGRPTGPDGRSLYRYQGAISLGKVLETEIQRRGWRRDLAGGWVQGHWDELVGEKIAQHTNVKMLKDKKLYITCDSTAWATNLRLMQRHILHTIAERVGPDIVVELQIYGPQAPNWRKGPLHVQGRGPRDTYG